MHITSFVLALFGSKASSPARPVHSRSGSLATAHQLCACLSWFDLRHALSFSQRCLQQPGQHFLRSVDISRHHFTLAFGYVIRLRFQWLGLCSGGSFSLARRLDATGFLGLGWCCRQSSLSVHQRPISDFPRVCGRYLQHRSPSLCACPSFMCVNTQSISLASVGIHSSDPFR